jgi:dipeptidyl aminopeptidase/acylaminoacyl peptidase
MPRATGDEASSDGKAAPVAAPEQPEAAPAPSQWKAPPQDILDVLHAERLPMVWTSPTGESLLLADRSDYPPLAEFAAGWHELAGMRVDPTSGGFHGAHGGTRPRIVRVQDGTETELPLSEGAEVMDVRWTADGQSFALVVRHPDHLGLWVGSVGGEVKRVEGVQLNPLLDSAARWMPDQERLLVRRVPQRGQPPPAPTVPTGPAILEGSGASAARSTYESRNLLKTAHDDALFDYFATCELAMVSPGTGTVEPLGAPAIYSKSSVSPDGQYLLVDRLIGPWSHAVPWWRFHSEIEVWDRAGKVVAKIASRPVAEEVPTHGVRTGPRAVAWRPTAPHSLFWLEALDGGDPVADVPHRDRLMRLDAPFSASPQEVFKAQHRIQSWNRWTAEGGTLMLTQRERIRRWQYTWLLDVDAGTARPWFDRNEADSYGSPGSPVFRPLDNGRMVLRQQGDAVFFQGQGATKDGDRPFLDLRSMKTGEVQRLFRSAPDRYESFVAFAGDPQHFVMRSESPTDVPNYYLATLGDEVDAEDGEPTRELSKTPITHFEDPTPQLRKIEKRIVKYERADGVPLSFHLHLPPDYVEGTPLPTVVYAYPLEYSDGSMAGQVRGSTQRFSRFSGPSHLFFLLRGYAVLDRTSMPMIGNPETTYDTFVKQLVADAEAAVAKAVEIGVADPDRIGVIGHSHGGLMVANLLAHTDLFKAGIARSGSYNKTNQPFGFQSERRSLFEARDVYIQVSPTFFADKVDEPVLIIHGASDSNPGTLTAQSEVFFEAVRGSGGTARMVLLPHEDHGYRARESVEHVLWEQLRWFDKYVKGTENAG